MTKNFDTLLEGLLSEMMPYTSDFGSGIDLGKAVSAKVPETKSQHWGPLQKLNPEAREKIITAIISKVFPDNEQNTHSDIIDNPEQLKGAINDAIVEVSRENPEFKAQSKWAAKFLSDRLANKELFGKGKYTTASGGEAKKEAVTQKEFKAALNKALQPSQAQEEPTQEPEVSQEEGEVEESPETQEREQETGVDLVYRKAADLNSDDADLQKAFAKLPDADLSWEKVLKLIGLSKATALMDAGALLETEQETQPAGEEEYGSEHKELDFDDEDDSIPGKFSFGRALKELDPYSSTTRQMGGPLGWD